LEVDYADDFWEMARNTPWYEKLLANATEKSTVQIMQHRPGLWQRLKRSYRKWRKNFFRLTVRPGKSQYRIICLGARLIDTIDNR
jgi:hypothetical protein